MMKIDSEVLEQFNTKLSSLVSDIEETWYLVKYLLNEMDIEVLYHNYNVDTELRSAYRKLEEQLERFEKMKLLTSTLPYDYEEMMNRHKEELNLMGEYAGGLNHTYLSLSNINHRQRVDTTYTNTAPIKYILEELYDIEGVRIDE